MRKIKKITVVSMAAVILTMSLTACGSNDVDNVSIKHDSSDASKITKNATEIADTSENAISETSDESILKPETYEDYIKLSDTYLQTDDVIQALAVLDEGIEKLSIGGQGAESQDIELLSQRKEYILAGTVAVRTKYVENEYDEEGEILTGYASERDENGNKIFSYYGTEREVSTAGEHRYDANGNEIEYEYKACDSDGNISSFSHETWAYDAYGNEIEYISYDEDGNISSKTVRKYDAFGNETEFANYNSDGECIHKWIQDYDKRGNLISEIRYDSNGRNDGKWEYEYDENGNKIKDILYGGDLIAKIDAEYEYDENSNIVKSVRYNTLNGEISSRFEYEYDENGNRIKTIFYGDKGRFIHKSEYEYDESGREIYEKLYNNNGIITYTAEYEYDAHGNKIKGTETSYNEETEQKESQTIDEYEYDENENMTKYAHIVYDEEKGADSRTWERIYDADGRETDFYLYMNEKTVSYHSQTEYDENGRMKSYTEYDKNGAVIGRKETGYDTDGNLIKESHYDADGSLIRCYENEYDDFGSITRQAMYEDGTLKKEEQIGYVYRYIGNMDTEAADDFTRFLKGQKEVCYYSGIVRKSITNLIDFSYCRKYKITPQYAFLDMTGDGVEELIINCDRYKLYVIQNVHGVLKVIFEANVDTGLMVKGNGRTGICASYSDRDSLSKIYYFLDENGKNQITLDAVWDSEGEVSYRCYDSFEWYSISEGEYYDMTEMMTEIDIDWQKLEDPNYGND